MGEQGVKNESFAFISKPEVINYNERLFVL